MDRSSAEGALVEAPKTPRGMGWGAGVSPSLPGEEPGEEGRKFYYLTSKWSVLVL